jgi:hypothetical protein
LTSFGLSGLLSGCAGTVRAAALQGELSLLALWRFAFFAIKEHIRFILLNWTLQATSVNIDTGLSAPVGGERGLRTARKM